MAKRDDIPKTDPSEIEALIQRLKHEVLPNVWFCREVGDIGTIAFLIVGSARIAFI